MRSFIFWVIAFWVANVAQHMPCPVLPSLALLCLALCVYAAVQHVKRLLQLQHLIERRHRGQRLCLISSLQRAAVSLSLILLHHAVSVSMQLSSLRPHTKQTTTPTTPNAHIPPPTSCRAWLVCLFALLLIAKLVIRNFSIF